MSEQTNQQQPQTEQPTTGWFWSKEKGWIERDLEADRILRGDTLEACAA